MGATSRQRAAETKRRRTRTALLRAASTLFSEHGWQDTRLEDVAAAARVSVATLYNHFGSRQELIGHTYAPLLGPLLESARAVADDDSSDVLTEIERCVRELAELARKQRNLTIALLAAVEEQTIKDGGRKPPAADDVRTIVPVMTPLWLLIVAAHRRGVISLGDDLDKAELETEASEIATYHTNGLLLRVLTRDESAEDTARLVLGQLLPALLARTMREGQELTSSTATRMLPEVDDISSMLVTDKGRRGSKARQRD